MQLTQQDKESLSSLVTSRGWQIICEAIEEDIRKYDEFLLSPDISDVIGEPEKKLAIINDQKKQRAFLVGLKSKPQDLLKSFVTVGQS